jgi:hypothetical protein
MNILMCVYKLQPHPAETYQSIYKVSVLYSKFGYNLRLILLRQTLILTLFEQKQQGAYAAAFQNRLKECTNIK